MRKSVASLCKTTISVNPGISYESMASICATEGFTLNPSTFRVYRSMVIGVKRKPEKELFQSEPPATAVAEVAPELETKQVHVTEAIPLDNGMPEHMKSFFEIPQIDETHVLNEELSAMFDGIHKASAIEPQNVRLTGPAGCGKTTTAMEFAARFKRPLLVMDCPNVREPRDWFGYKDIDPKTGNIYWHKSLFYRFIQHDNVVVVLDEINRINPMVINTLLPLLDGRRSTYLEEAGEKINVGKGVVFFSTTNEGREFTGTVQLDLAQADRLSTKIECTYLPEKEESNLISQRTGLPKGDAQKLVQVANHVRRKFMADSGDSFTQSISTRMLLNAAQKMHLAGPKTMRYTLLSHFSDDGKEQSERAQLLKLLTGKFGPVI